MLLESSIPALIFSSQRLIHSYETHQEKVIIPFITKNAYHDQLLNDHYIHFDTRIWYRHRRARYNKKYCSPTTVKSVKTHLQENFTPVLHNGSRNSAFVLGKFDLRIFFPMTKKTLPQKGNARMSAAFWSVFTASSYRASLLAGKIHGGLSLLEVWRHWSNNRETTVGTGYPCWESELMVLCSDT